MVGETRGDGVPGETERRRSPRILLNLRMSLRQRGRGAVPATVAGLSRHGCLVAESLLSTHEEMVFVKLPGLESQLGRLVWTNGEQAGVMFHQPLHVAVVDRFRDYAGDAGGACQLGAPRLGETGGTVIEMPVTRREQIMAGHADPEAAILRHKKRTGARSLSDLVTRTIPRRAEHRREERHARFNGHEAIEVTVAGRPALVENLSPSGLMTRVALEDGVGGPVTVEFAGFPAYEGRLIWLRAGSAGIELPAGAIELN